MTNNELNQKPALADTADIETSSDDYASRFSGPTGVWMLSVQERIVVKMMSVYQGSTVLDVGGGHGQLAAPLCALGHKVTVLGSHESCRMRISGLVETGKCTFKVAELLNLPYPDKAFDYTVSFRLLPHCTQWQKLIAELCRVARRSVIVDYPTTRSLNCFSSKLFAAKKRIEGNTRSFALFKHDDVTLEFKKNGFEPSQRRGEFVVPMVVHRMLKCPPLSASLEGCCRALGLTAFFGSPVIVEMRRKEEVEQKDTGRIGK